MSKASEWAEKNAAVAERFQPKFCIRRPGEAELACVACVDPQGDFRYHGSWLKPDEAIRLARWILATFGDD